MPAEFIAPVLDWLQAVVRDMEIPEGMEPWSEVRRSFTGVVVNWPMAAVMPRFTEFDPEGSAIHEQHEFTVKFGVSAAEPDAVTDAAIARMAAIDRAIQRALLPAMVTRVFVADHDYGPLYQKGAGFAFFPELHLEVEAYESPV